MDRVQQQMLPQVVVDTDLGQFECSEVAIGYRSGGRRLGDETVGEELSRNVHVHEGVSEEEFVKMRTARDATLSAPTLLLPSIQVNMRAGKLPPADVNGIHYLRVPVTLEA